MAIALVFIGVYNCKKLSFSEDFKTKSYSGVKNLTSGCSKTKASSNLLFLKLNGIFELNGSKPRDILFLLHLIFFIQLNLILLLSKSTLLKYGCHPTVNGSFLSSKLMTLIFKDKNSFVSLYVNSTRNLNG